MSEGNICIKCMTTIQTINPELNLCNYCIDREYEELKKYFSKSYKVAIIVFSIAWMATRILEVHPSTLIVFPAYIKFIIYLTCILAPFGQPYIKKILGGSMISLPVEVLTLFEIFLSGIAVIAAPNTILSKYKELKRLEPHTKKYRN